MDDVMRTSTRAVRGLFAVVAAAGLVLTGQPDAGAVLSTPAHTAHRDNPLAGGTWGVYTGPADGVYPAYQRATGHDRKLLARVALRPRVRWFGSWIPTREIQAKIGSYVTATQAGDPKVLVQLAVFRLWPHGEGAKNRPMGKHERQQYRSWIRAAARGIGDARTAVVLEPDLAVALTGWRPGRRMALTAYAARVLGALPRTSVYLDASDADWLPVRTAVTMLHKSGVRHTRGFALGATHYSSTAGNIAYGNKLVRGLARAGVPGRHFIIDTADNGRPFTWLQYRSRHPHGDFDNAQTCRTRAERRCDTLGIPPTWHVGSTRWQLPTGVRQAARRHVDGYLWFGRPWLVRQASPFSLKRTLAVARTTPYADMR